VSILFRLTSTFVSALLLVGVLFIAPAAIERVRAVDPVPAPALDTLAPDAGRLSPAFAPEISAYVLKTSTAISSVDLNATGNDAGATVSCAVLSASVDCAAVALSVGDTEIVITVTAADALTAVYTIVAQRADPSASSDSSITALTFSSGSLTPSFDQSIVDYVMAVGTAHTLTLGYTLSAGADAVCTINGSIGDCASIELPGGPTPASTSVTISVTAADQVVVTLYSFTVGRTASSDATLASVGLDAGAFDAAFNPAYNDLTQSVTTTAATIDLTPVTADRGATVACLVDSSPLPCTGISLTTVSPPAVSVSRVLRVTAEDGVTVRSYPIAIRRVAILSNDATLHALLLTGAALSPTFSSGTYAYTGTTISTSLDIEPTPAAGASAACTVAATPTACSGILLPLGVTALAVVVTAADGTTNQSYTISLTRTAASSVAALADLTVTGVELSPGFDAAQLSYAGVTASESAELLPTAADNGTAVCRTAGTVHECAHISLALGLNVITVRVTAQDAVSTADYLISLTRQSTDSGLQALALSGITLSPAFDPAVHSYSATTVLSATTVTLTPATGATATCVLDRVLIPCGVVPLALGVNTIEIELLAEDTVSSTMTTLTVIRLSDDAALTEITVSSGTLSPLFVATRRYYTVETGAAVLTIRAIGAAGSTAVCRLAQLAISCSLISLDLGETRIAVVNTAEDGVSALTYQLLITRSEEAILSVASSGPTESAEPLLIEPGTLYTTEAVEVVEQRSALVATVAPPSNELDPILVGIVIAVAGLLLGTGIAFGALLSVNRRTRTEIDYEV
jgi:hypothetical protein